jgi:hypothetical protein
MKAKIKKSKMVKIVEVARSKPIKQIQAEVENEKKKNEMKRKKSRR